MAGQVDIGMPSGLDLVAGYTLRLTAVDGSGNLVAGVNVQTVVITATGSIAGGNGGGAAPGEWFLVPGSQA